MPYGQGGYSQQKNSSKPWIIVGVIVAVLAIVGVILFFILGGDDDGDNAGPNTTQGQDTPGLNSDQPGGAEPGGDSPGIEPGGTTPGIDPGNGTPVGEPGGTTPGIEPGGGSTSGTHPGTNTAGKPTKDEVRAGIEAMMTDQFELAGLTPEDFEYLGINIPVYYDCIADEIYDTMSDGALRALADNRPDVLISPSDDAILTAAGEGCLPDF